MIFPEKTPSLQYCKCKGFHQWAVSSITIALHESEIDNDIYLNENLRDCVFKETGLFIHVYFLIEIGFVLQKYIFKQVYLSKYTVKLEILNSIFGPTYSCILTTLNMLSKFPFTFCEDKLSPFLFICSFFSNSKKKKLSTGQKRRGDFPPILSKY